MSYHLTNVEHGKIVALKDEDYSNAACAVKVGCSIKTVSKCWKRYEEEGEGGLKQRNTTGGPRTTIDDPG